MKTYNVTNRLSKQAKTVIQNTINTIEYYKGCYFWTPAKSADQRRMNERNFEANNKPFELITKKGVISVHLTYSQSCKNVYFSSVIMRDGNVSNVSILKNLIK
jgi:hypothetical protein